ncbi:MAG: hypothetical protein WC455_27405 [Dehalococcoidia bacterium]|jgi:hypothetical protein
MKCDKRKIAKSELSYRARRAVRKLLKDRLHSYQKAGVWCMRRSGMPMEMIARICHLSFKTAKRYYDEFNVPQAAQIFLVLHTCKGARVKGITYADPQEIERRNGNSNFEDETNAIRLS